MSSIFHPVVLVYCCLLPYSHIGEVTMNCLAGVYTNVLLQREGCSEVHYGARYKNLLNIFDKQLGGNPFKIT